MTQHDPIPNHNRKTDLEQKAEAAVIEPLANYVCRIGMTKPVSDYSRSDIEGLITTVLDNYHSTLQALYKDEVPF